MFEYLSGQTVLVTGGCGTVGHELAKQFENKNIKHVVFSRNEAAQFKLQQLYPHIKCYLGDIKSEYDLERVFREVKPHVVIHGAAVKVVPVAEREMVHTFETNAMGSYFVARKCLEHNVETALAIGTDKQCAPINVYGMSKHLMASIFSDYNRQGKTRFVNVRYGNVLCSRSSLGVIIMEQAAKGLPLTVTDPDMTRFFFTIQDGVELIDYALTYAINNKHDYYGETFSTQMCAAQLGDLFNIVASKFYVPVQVIGRREGEKTHESLMADYELKDTLKEKGPICKYTGHQLWRYMTQPHSQFTEKRRSLCGVDTVFSSDIAPRLSQDQIWDMLQDAYKGTWKD
jgi:FlaA1/EpsC-like NDP-sugar epimerase